MSVKPVVVSSNLLIGRTEVLYVAWA